ncbi:hypothetical protein [Paraclostridium sordellii]|uniref:hypothetical protein n=1 Tax=Paraclostridium sordellii TaxID=1505 RepID=UPI0005E3093B|nr:hypothetical protein [Paeniclostridium sordellii]CEP49081.1 Uncharacterised protein [[Clostridium] sordellii] [Paeniclostridium sordellii]
MNFKNKNEGKIIIFACIFTVIIVLAFSLMQGRVKSKKSECVSKESVNERVELTKDDYEVIKKDENGSEKIFIVLEKRNLNSKEKAYLVNELGKKSSGKFKVYLFNDKSKASDFEYKTEQIQTVAKPIDSKKVEIKKYNIIDKESKDEPQNYSIESINKKDGNTYIEIDLKNTNEPEKALAQIKFLGDNIRNLNYNKNLGILEIKAYFDEENSPSWEYTSENKNLIIHNQIVEVE